MRHRWRLAVTGTTSAAFVVAGLIVSLTSAPARDVVAIERPPPDTAEVAPRPPVTGPRPGPSSPGQGPAGDTEAPARAAAVPFRTAVVAREAARWELLAGTDGVTSCLELRTPGWSSGSILCDPSGVDHGAGDLALLATPAGPALVAAVDPSVTGVRGVEAGPLGTVTDDPFRDDLRWFVTAELGDHRVHGADAGLLLESGDHTVGRLLLPDGRGVHRAGSYGMLVAAPYGRWDGYRRASMPGTWLGGVEEVGFHDGDTGVRCTLHRRFAGSREQVIAERCPPPAPHLPVADAFLVPAGVPGHHVLHAVTDRPATSWRCHAPTGAMCEAAGPLAVRDPGGSGRRVLTGSAPLRVAGTDRVTLVVLGPGGIELGRVGLTVPAG